MQLLFTHIHCICVCLSLGRAEMSPVQMSRTNPGWLYLSHSHYTSHLVCAWSDSVFNAVVVVLVGGHFWCTDITG